MSKENDDFVEDLVKNLPKGRPMSEFELKKFEKLIDSEIASSYPATKRNSVTQRMSIAASVVAIFIGVGIFATQNNSLNSDSLILPTPNPSVTNDSNPADPTNPSDEPTQTDGNSNTGNQGQLFEDEPTVSSEEVPVFRSRIDYETNFAAAKKNVKLANKPGKFTSLSSIQRNCAITLGIEKDLLAFDSAYFGPDAVMAFYVGQTKSDYVVKIALSTCELVSELEND
jgi:hypothetical protein